MSSLPDPRRAQLRRLKAIALAMLAVMVSGFILAHAMGNTGIWAWVRAFCEAATVGALADWFAVVALFRHPLGLPIPHTAIIPANKARIADNLAVFVRDHFLDPPQLLERLRVFDPAARLGAWLAEPRQARRAADMARSWILEALRLVDERAVRDALQRFLVARLQGWDAARTAGEVLALLTRDGRHQALLDQGLQQLARALDNEAVKARVSDVMVAYARREWPRMVGAIDRVKSVDRLGDKLAERLAKALMSELQSMLADPTHPVRADYAAWLQDYLGRLRSDPTLAEQVAAIKTRLLDHPDLALYLQQVWTEVREALARDLAREDSALGGHVERSLLAMGRALGEDPALREAINRHVLDGAQSLAGRLRAGVTEHIAQTVKAWDERQLVDELELSVGRDLQYIRFNGTLVGGIIGVILHAAVLLFTG